MSEMFKYITYLDVQYMHAEFHGLELTTNIVYRAI